MIKEQANISQELNEQLVELMGDTPINLSSPEQLSMVIYSRKPVSKSDWSEHFTKYMSKKDFDGAVKNKSDIVYKTKAIQCSDCFGRGYTLVKKKDGTTGKGKFYSTLVLQADEVAAEDRIRAKLQADGCFDMRVVQRECGTTHKIKNMTEEGKGLRYAELELRRLGITRGDFGNPELSCCWSIVVGCL